MTKGSRGRPSWAEERDSRCPPREFTAGRRFLPRPTVARDPAGASGGVGRRVGDCVGWAAERGGRAPAGLPDRVDPQAVLAA